MEEISVGGEKYLKASLLAKKFGYTSDYLGQLCRSNQVKATLIGRSWYITEESILQHKQGRYRSTSAKSKEQLREAAVKLTQATKIAPVPRFKYEGDEGDLIPSLAIKQSEVLADEQTSDVEKVRENPDFKPNSESNIKINISSTPVRRPTPPFRTIPNFEASQPRFKEVKMPQRAAVSTLAPRQKSYKLAFLVLAILMLEAAALYGALGLEKRLTASQDNTAMVLYGFDVSAAHAILSESILYR